MTTYVALLYSVIVTRTRRVVMADLRGIAEGLGYRNVRTLVWTGNLVFDAPDASPAEIEAALERRFAEFHGRHVDIIAMTAGDWRKVVAGNPFPEESAAHPERVTVRVMREAAPLSVLEKFRPYQTSGEQVRIVDGHVWIAFATQPNQSKLLAILAPNRMGGIGTLRNWNTVRGLGEMLQGDLPPDP